MKKWYWYFGIDKTRWFFWPTVEYVNAFGMCDFSLRFLCFTVSVFKH